MYAHPMAQQQYSISALPAAWRPRGLEVVPFSVQPPPSPMDLDHRLQLWKALEGHRDGELNPLGVKKRHDFIGEKGRILARLQSHPGKTISYRGYAIPHEAHRAVGVMHVARSVKHVQNLRTLRHGAEQRIIAALTLLLGVISDRQSLGVSAAGNHRTIEVHRHSGETFLLQPIQHQGAVHVLELCHRLLIHPGQCSAHRRDVGQTAQSQGSSRQWIITISIKIPQSTISQHQMHDDKQCHCRKSDNQAFCLVCETPMESFPQSQVTEQGLQQYEAGERGQPIVFEPKFGQAVDAAMNLRFAGLHVWWPPAQ